MSLDSLDAEIPDEIASAEWPEDVTKIVTEKFWFTGLGLEHVGWTPFWGSVSEYGTRYSIHQTSLAFFGM